MSLLGNNSKSRSNNNKINCDNTKRGVVIDDDDDDDDHHHHHHHQQQSLSSVKNISVEMETEEDDDEDEKLHNIDRKMSFSNDKIDQNDDNDNDDSNFDDELLNIDQNHIPLMNPQYVLSKKSTRLSTTTTTTSTKNGSSISYILSPLMSSFFRLFHRSNRHRRHHQNGRRVLSYRSSASSATKTNSNLIRNHKKFSQKPLSNQYKMIKCNEYDIDVSSSSSTSKSLLETNLIRQLLRRTRYPLLLFCFVFFFVIQFRANHYVVTSTSNNMMPMMINTLNRNGTSFNSTIIINHNNLNLNNHLNLTTKPITIKPIIDVAHNNNNCTNCTIIDSCPSKPNKLVGRLKVLTNPPSMIEMESKLNQISIGGRFRPDQCRPRDRVAIIVPYRDREQHLRTFLWNMHPMLMRQNIDYAIYIVEQYGNDRFNRAKLMNVGFLEAGKQYDYDCYIFHDVDLIPEDDRNLYTCPKQPRHMSVAVDKFRYRLPYKDLFGGVSALTREQFLTVNGFSNEFWGWGGEDDDMSNRVRHHHYKIERYPKEIARYTMLKHDQDAPSADRFKKLYNGWRRFQTDGINNTQYEVIDITFKKLYTLISVDVLAPTSIAKSSKNGYHKKHVFNAASASATAHKRRTRFYAYQHPSSLFSHRFH